MTANTKGLEKENSSLMFREITPPHGWEEDPNAHYLRLTLPGFKAENITIHMDKYGQLVVRGDRQLSEHKFLTFEERFDVPNDADMEEASGLFRDDQIYIILIPKKHEDYQRITMPKEENISQKKDETKGKQVHPFHDSMTKPDDLPEVPEIVPKPKTRLPLVIIKRDKSKKKIVFFVATLIVLLVVGVVLIVKLRHR